MPKTNIVTTTSAATILQNESIANAMRDISRLARAMTNSGRKKTERVGLEQFWILRLLYDSGPQRIKDIAEEIGITPSPVTISVKKLAGSKLVTRERGKADERIVTVRLTDEGRRFFESWRSDRNQALSSLFNVLDDREREELNQLLGKVLSEHIKTRESGVQTEFDSSTSGLQMIGSSPAKKKKRR
jgi:DNA-binding MarR family transcriptional regulator